MALNDEAVFTAAKGYIYTGIVDVDGPTEQQIYDFVDHSTVLTGWALIGHTSRDDLPEFGFDGGDTETRGTWQNQALRTVVTEPAVDYVTFNLVQFDADTLELYYGQSNTLTGASYGLAESPGGATDSALLVVIVDGDNKIAFYSPKTELRREDAITLAVDEFGALPMRATFLKNTAPGAVNTDLFQWIPGVDSTP
jgi:hypothetical protein